MSNIFSSYQIKKSDVQKQNRYGADGTVRVSLQ